MSNRTWWVVGGVGVGLLLLIWIPWWASLLIIAAVIGVPVVSYLMLDPSQRRRLKRIRARNKEIGG